MFNPAQYKIIFMGTPDFAVPSLRSLIEKKYNIIAVITQPDKPVGREGIVQMPVVKKYALEKNLNVLQASRLKNNNKFINKIKALKPDCIIVAAYGKIIPKEILDIPKFGCLNIHGSLLPKYRGASPIQNSILNGDSETGLTIMKLDEGLDTGDILGKTVIRINSDDTSIILHDKLSKKGAELLIKILPKYFMNKIKPKKQNEKFATYANIIMKEDGEINWNNTATKIYNQIRAFTPWPGTYTFLENKRLKIIKAKIPKLKRQTSSKPGKVYVEEGRMLVLCGNNTWLEIFSLQLEGKKELSTKDFIKGKDITKEILGK